MFARKTIVFPQAQYIKKYQLAQIKITLKIIPHNFLETTMLTFIKQAKRS